MEINLNQHIHTLFSAFYIEQAKQITPKILARIFEGLLIKKKIANYISPTELFENINFQNHYIYAGLLDFQIKSEIDSVMLSSVEIQQLMISNFLSGEFIFKNTSQESMAYFDRQILTLIYDYIPESLKTEISIMIFSFCAEFDLSAGRIDIEYYKEVLSTYSRFEHFSPTEIYCK